MCNKPNEVEVSIRERAWVENRRDQKKRGKRKNTRGAEKVKGEESLKVEVLEPMDEHTNWLNSCAMTGINQQLAERLWIEAVEPDAHELLDWYFNEDPNAIIRVAHAIRNGRFDAADRAEHEDNWANYWARMGRKAPGRSPFVR